MNSIFHQEAENELNQAIDYYEDCSKGLGHDFAIEVYATIERILHHPKAWSFIDEAIRRALVKLFPYGVLYAESDNGIFIVAIMNLATNLRRDTTGQGLTVRPEPSRRADG